MRRAFGRFECFLFNMEERFSRYILQHKINLYISHNQALAKYRGCRENERPWHLYCINCLCKQAQTRCVEEVRHEITLQIGSLEPVALKPCNKLLKLVKLLYTVNKR